MAFNTAASRYMWECYGPLRKKLYNRPSSRNTDSNGNVCCSSMVKLLSSTVTVERAVDKLCLCIPGSIASASGTSFWSRATVVRFGLGIHCRPRGLVLAEILPLLRIFALQSIVSSAVINSARNFALQLYMCAESAGRSTGTVWELGRNAKPRIFGSAGTTD